MGRLLRSELLKVRTRASFWILVGALAFVGLLAALQAIFTDERDLLLPENQESILAAAGAGFFFPLVAGILLVTGEFWHKTITHTFLAAPARELVVAAKLIAAAVAGLAYVVVSTALAAGLGFAIVLFRGVDLNLDGGAAAELLGLLVLAMIFFAVFGSAIGLVVRNQLAAVIGALAWFLAIEPLLIGLVPKVGKFTPSGAAQAIDPTGGAEELLSAWAGGAVLAAWVIGFIAIGTVLTARRDIT